MDLDDELRRVFAAADDRLDVPVRANAEEMIVAGARRRRRRRIVATAGGGAVAVVVAVVGGVLLTNPHQDAMPPAISETVTPTSTSDVVTSSSVSSPAVTSAAATVPSTGTSAQRTERTETQETQPDVDDVPPPQPLGEQIGPMAWRGVRLGMTHDETLASGFQTSGESNPGGSCSAYGLFEQDGTSAGTMWIASDGKVASVSSKGPVHTPEGVSPGWTVAQVRTVYPQVVDAASPQLVPVPGNRDGVYRFQFDGGVLKSIILERGGHSCYS